MNKYLKTKHYFPIFLVISFSLHSLVILLFLFYNKKAINELKANTLLVKEKEPKIFVELTEFKDDFVTKDSEIVGRYNYEGKGRLTLNESKKQHIPGKFTPKSQASQSSLNVSSKTKSKETKKSKEKVSKNKQEKLKSVKVKENNDTFIKKQEEEKPVEKTIKTLASNRLAVETKNSLKINFSLKDSNKLQIRTQAISEASFVSELKAIFTQQFNHYLIGGGAINFYYMHKDNISVLAEIDQKGNLLYKNMLEESNKQPYLNYLANRMVNNHQLKNLPQNFFTMKNNETLLLKLSIAFTGEPLKKWWFNIEFIGVNSS